ncbi:Putative disease resistance RPP13-like protein 1 [Linum perenne]
MAEIILLPIGKEILSKLTGLALSELGLWWTLQRELDRLEATMSTINAVLLDAELKQKQSNQIRVWLGNLSEAMYDADDLLDDFATEASIHHQHQQVSEKCSCCTVVSCLASVAKKLYYELKMAHSVKVVRQRLDDIAADRQTLMLEPDRSEFDDCLDERETVSSPPFLVIGRQNDMDEIVPRLLHEENKNNNNNIYVLPIVGFGGMGKTTLAQLIFDAEQIKARFEIRTWVYVSQSFDLKTVVKNILVSVTGEEIQVKDPQLNFLKDCLHSRIAGRSSLIVLDDVWDEDGEKWRLLRQCMGSSVKMVVTTRSEGVARVAGTTKPHHLLGISVDESWDLISRMVFDEGEPSSQRVIDVGKGIANKCGGIPLAVNSIASLLRFKDPETEWSSFLENELSTIPEGDKSVMSTLRLSYDYLAPKLKYCFTYCNLFPKGHEIQVPMLVQLWIAQGFIGSWSSTSKNPEDLGLQCFEKLWWGSFFQEVKRDGFGNIMTCKMHDLMHDLAASVAEDRIIALDDLVDSSNGITARTRHVALRTIYEEHPDPDNNNNHSSSDEDDSDDDDDRDRFKMPSLEHQKEVPQSLLEANQLRTLLFIPTMDGNGLTRRQCEAMLHGIRRARVLGLSHIGPAESMYAFALLLGYGFRGSEKKQAASQAAFSKTCTLDVQLLDSISKLKHLRYLDFSCNFVDEVPDSITLLVNLQVLNLSGCLSINRLPVGIEKLVNLRHLYCKGCNQLTHMPKGIGKLTSLQTLDVFVVANPSKFGDDVAAGLEELKELKSLGGELTIEGLQHLQQKTSLDHAARVSYLKDKERLQSLKLRWKSPNDDDDEDDDHDDDDARVSTAESWLERLRPHGNLRELRIVGYTGLKFPSWVSNGMQNLADITLEDCEKCEYLPPLHHSQSLKKLTVSGCRNLKGFYKDIDSSITISCNDDEEEEEEKDITFHCLSSLTVSNCPRLNRMPLFPTLDAALLWEGTSSAAFLRTINMLPGAMSKLKELGFENVGDLESLPEEWLANLVCIESLTFVKCRRLVSLPPAMRRLTYLRSLNIFECPQLEERCRKGEGADWNNVSHIPKISFGFNSIGLKEPDPPSPCTIL